MQMGIMGILDIYNKKATFATSEFTDSYSVGMLQLLYR